MKQAGDPFPGLFSCPTPARTRRKRTDMRPPSRNLKTGRLHSLRFSAVLLPCCCSGLCSIHAIPAVALQTSSALSHRFRREGGCFRATSKGKAPPTCLRAVLRPLRDKFSPPKHLPPFLRTFRPAKAPARIPSLRAFPCILERFFACTSPRFRAHLDPRPFSCRKHRAEGNHCCLTPLRFLKTMPPRKTVFLKIYKNMYYQYVTT